MKIGRFFFAWLVPVIAFAVTAATLHPYRIDDSFISFRYARNLAAGHGVVFNAGERVEGYTNFLWVLLLAAGAKLGLDVEGTAIALGTAAALVTILLTARLGLFLDPEGGSGPLGALLLACSSPFVFWAFSGMETSAFTALLVVATSAVVRAGQAEGSAPAAGISLAALCLVRPDGAVAAMVLLGALLAAPAGGRRRASATAIAAIAVLVPYAAWKLAYYGTLVPNTAHAKVGYTVAQLWRGARYGGNFLLFTAAAGLVPAALLGVRPRAWADATLVALVLTHAAYVVVVGGDSFLFFRFLVPLLPFLCLFAARGFERVRDALAPRKGFSAVFPAAVFLACLLGIGYAQQGHYRQTIRDKASINVRYRSVGLWLRDHSAPEDALAVVAAGIIPYYAERTTIDMLGLTDAHIAGRAVDSMGFGMAGHEKGDGRYVLARRPRFILLHPVTTAVPATPEQIAARSRSFLAARELWNDPEFHRLYALRSVALGDFHFNFFERRDVGYPVPTS